MRVEIAALLTVTSDRESHLPAREVDQTILIYAGQHIAFRRSELLETLTILVNKRDISVPLFLVLPEFYWNVRWDALKNERDLHELTDFYFNQLPSVINDVLLNFPREKYGEIILIAGTVAVLIETSECQQIIYESVSYCLIVNNNLNADGLFEASMWPKQNVSFVDFGKQIGDSGDIILCQLSESLDVPVFKKSKVAAEHYSLRGYGFYFDNKIVQNIPFSINICLDYSTLEPDEQEKMQISKQSKIDFLVACGAKLNSHIYPSSVEFAIRNDGLSPGAVEFFAVKNKIIDRKIEPRFISSKVATLVLNVT